MPEHTVGQDECIASIAKAHGLSPETIWNHPENAALRERRGDPNVLNPGDTVFVPERRERYEDRPTEQRHRFRRRGTPAKLRLQIMTERVAAPDESGAAGDSAGGDRAAGRQEPGREGTDDDARDDQPSAWTEHEPRANVPYAVNVEGVWTEGQTDEDGRLEVTIPPDARRGRLVLEPGTERETVYPLALGRLNPVDTLSGVRQRLASLGHECEDLESETEDENLQAELRWFQDKHGLEVTGQADEATRAKLQELYGG